MLFVVMRQRTTPSNTIYWQVAKTGCLLQKKKDKWFVLFSLFYKTLNAQIVNSKFGDKKRRMLERGYVDCHISVI